MRRTWNGLALLTAALLGLTGCASIEPQVKPDSLPESYKPPPDDDVRFSKPPVYPEGTLNRDMLAKPNQTPGGITPQGGGPRPPGMRAGAPY